MTILKHKPFAKYEVKKSRKKPSSKSLKRTIDKNAMKTQIARWN
jgi:hypothetical protein